MQYALKDDAEQNQILIDGMCDFAKRFAAGEPLAKLRCEKIALYDEICGGVKSDLRHLWFRIKICLRILKLRACLSERHLKWGI